MYHVGWVWWEIVMNERGARCDALLVINDLNEDKVFLWVEKIVITFVRRCEMITDWLMIKKSDLEERNLLLKTSQEILIFELYVGDVVQYDVIFWLIYSNVIALDDENSRNECYIRMISIYFSLKIYFCTNPQLPTKKRGFSFKIGAIVL